MIDLSLLRIRAFALSNGVTIVMASGFYAYTLCNVLFLTSVWRYSILTAGLALTPGPFTAMAVAGPASRLVERVGHRPVVVPGALVWAGGMACFASRLGVTPDFLGEWLPGMVILGIGAGLTFPTLSGAAVGSVPGPRFAVATSLNSVARQVGAALGVAILIAILGNPPNVNGATPVALRELALGELRHFQHGWLFAGGCFLAGSLVCLGLVVARPGEDAKSEARGQHTSSDEQGPAREQPAGPELPSLAESDGEQAAVAPQTVAEFLRNVPVFAGLSAEMLERVAELASDVEPGSRGVAVPGGRARGRGVRRARRPPGGRANRANGAGRSGVRNDQHAHAGRGAGRAGAAERVGAQRLDSRAARHASC